MALRDLADIQQRGIWACLRASAFVRDMKVFGYPLVCTELLGWVLLVLGVTPLASLIQQRLG